MLKVISILVGAYCVGSQGLCMGSAPETIEVDAPMRPCRARKEVMTGLPGEGCGVDTKARCMTCCVHTEPQCHAVESGSVEATMRCVRMTCSLCVSLGEQRSTCLGALA